MEQDILALPELILNLALVVVCMCCQNYKSFFIYFLTVTVSFYFQTFSISFFCLKKIYKLRSTCISRNTKKNVYHFIKVFCPYFTVLARFNISFKWTFFSYTVFCFVCLISNFLLSNYLHVHVSCLSLNLSLLLLSPTD